MVNVKKTIFAFSISMLAVLLTNGLLGTSQLPEGLTPYWVIGGVFGLFVMRRGFVDRWVSLVRAMRGLP